MSKNPSQLWPAPKSLYTKPVSVRYLTCVLHVSVQAPHRNRAKSSMCHPNSFNPVAILPSELISSVLGDPNTTLHTNLLAKKPKMLLESIWSHGWCHFITVRWMNLHLWLAESKTAIKYFPRITQSLSHVCANCHHGYYGCCLKKATQFTC